MTRPTRTERSRALILDAAEQAFRDLGFAGTTIETIATRAGLTRKTVYNLFGSKEEIAQRLILRAEAQDGGYRARMAAEEDALALIVSILTDSAAWCLANPALARLALNPARRPSFEPPADRPSFQGIVRDAIVLGQRQGIIRADEDAGFMSLVLQGIFGQAMLNSLSDDSLPAQNIRHIVRIVVEGIGVQKRGD